MEEGILLTGGKLVDVTTKTIRDADILITGSKIKSVLDRPYRTILEYEKEIDISGKWVIPGLIDMHCHIKDRYAPHFTAAGVTTVRNTAGNVIELENLRSSSLDAPTPRVIAADRMIDGPPGLWGDTSPSNLVTDDIDEALAEVHRQVNVGADFIKVYGLLKPYVMQAVIEEAHRLGVEVSCDLVQHREVTAIDVAEYGMDWFEHNSGFIQAVHPEWNMYAEEEIWDNIDWDHPNDEAIRKVCEQVIAHGAKLCPTTVLYDQQRNTDHPWWPSQPVTDRVEQNKMLMNIWNHLSQYKKELNKLGKQTNYIQRISKIYHDLGGTVVAGTDTPAGTWTLPGLALHRELELFVDAGFTEWDSLRAATIVAAESIKRFDIGSIEEGKIADMVILNENPIDQITNTQTIDFVVKGGHRYSQEEIFSHEISDEEAERRYHDFVEKFQKEEV